MIQIKNAAEFFQVLDQLADINRILGSPSAYNKRNAEEFPSLIELLREKQTEYQNAVDRYMNHK